MSITFEMIQKANEAIQTTDIKGKQYAEVNQRIKAFRMVYPAGFISTEMVSNENGVCIIRATCGTYADNMVRVVLGVGTAYEKEGSTFINKTSYIENCETSAVGRALGMAGFGIDVSVASAEEVQNAILNQEHKSELQERGMEGRKASAYQVKFLAGRYTGDNLTKLLAANGLSRLEDMPMTKASELIEKLKGEK